MTGQNLNFTTTLALLAWPLVAAWLYSTRSIGQATAWTILGGYLLLPEQAFFKIPVIPPFDKNSIPALAALFASMLVSGRRIRPGRGFGLVEVLLLVYVLSPLITSLLNSDEIVRGPRVLPGLGAYEGAAVVAYQSIVVIPFFLGRRLLCSATDTENTLRILAAAGLVYSLPMLFEIRMSPQLHTWVYGYFPQWFIEQMRDGGFRPVVFLENGLETSFFVMTAAVAAAALWRIQVKIARFPAGGVTAYLSAVLVLCKTLSALIYGVALVPLVRWATPKMQLRIAIAMVTVALSYPILRTMDVVPTTAMLDAANMVNADRARSLETRFRNESELLDRASAHFWFGWGRFGRGWIYDASGNDITLPDGRWIITMDTFGFIGFLAEFGLLALSVFRAASALKFAKTKRDSILFAALALIISINIFDLIPNAILAPWSWLLTGALLGRAEMLRDTTKRRSFLNTDPTHDEERAYVSAG